MPAVASSSRLGPRFWQHDTRLPSTTTAGTVTIPYSAALAAAVAPGLSVKADPSVWRRSWTVTSQSGQAISWTNRTAGSQTGQPALNTSTCLLATVSHLLRGPYTFNPARRSRDNLSVMRIGELAERSGMEPTTIRYYEHIGLMPPPARRQSGYR